MKKIILKIVKDFNKKITGKRSLTKLKKYLPISDECIIIFSSCLSDDYCEIKIFFEGGEILSAIIWGAEDIGIIKRVNTVFSQTKAGYKLSFAGSDILKSTAKDFPSVLEINLEYIAKAWCAHNNGTLKELIDSIPKATIVDIKLK